MNQIGLKTMIEMNADLNDMRYDYRLNRFV